MDATSRGFAMMPKARGRTPRSNDADWLAAGDRFAIEPGLPLLAGPQFHRKGRHGSVFHGAVADTEPDGWARRVLLRDHAKQRQEARRTERAVNRERWIHSTSCWRSMISAGWARCAFGTNTASAPLRADTRHSVRGACRRALRKAFTKGRLAAWRWAARQAIKLSLLSERPFVPKPDPPPGRRPAGRLIERGRRRPWG